MSGQYQDLQARIADELARGDLAAQIVLAIQSAIRAYERERFVFNEALAGLTTVAGREWYGTGEGLPADLVEIDSVRLTVGGRAVPLTPRPFGWLERVAGNPATTGQPSDWTAYAGQLRLYPAPAAAWPLRLAYLRRLPALVAPTDANDWTATAEELIRLRAKADLLINVIRDPDAQQMQLALSQQGKRFLSPMEEAAFAALRHETTRRQATGRVLPTVF